MSTDPSATPPAEDHASTAKDILTLVLICILVVVIAAGLMGVAPGLGIALLILLAPILVRVATGPPQAGPGKPRTGAQKAMGFFGSLGVLISIGLAAFAAFYATCFVVCLGGLTVENLRGGRGEIIEWIVYPSVAAGLAVGGLVAVRLFRRLWLRKG